MTKKWLIGERFLPHCLLYCSLRLVYFSAISRIIVGDVYKVVVRARAIRDLVADSLNQLGGASPAFTWGTMEYQVATVCQTKTKTQSDGNMDP